MDTTVLEVGNSSFEQDYWVRRADTFGDSYPVPIVPYEDEILEDLLVRAACENGYAPITSYKLLGVTGNSVSCSKPGVNRFGISAEALTTLIGNPGGIAEIEHLLHTQVAPRASQRPFFGTWIDSSLFMRVRRVSPRALEAKGYLRAMWRLWPITFDTGTKEMLITNCPECKKPLMAGFMGDVWCCDRCAKIDGSGQLNAVDLRSYKQGIVPKELWEGLDFVTSFVDPTALATREIARSQLHSDFNEMADGQVFSFAIGMARCLMLDSGCRVQHMEPQVLHRVSEIILDWPRSVEQIVVAGSDIRSKPHSFKSLPYRTSVSVPIRERIRSLGKITVVAKRISRAMVESSDQIDTVSLRAKPEVRSFSASVGLPIPTIADMADGYIFPEEISEAAFIDFADCAHQFSQRLNARVETSRLPKGRVGLARAVVALQTRIQDPWPSILTAILDGRLKVWRGHRRRIVMDDLFVSDLRVLTEITSADMKSSDERLHTEISYLEAQRWTRLAGFFHPVISAGLIKPPFTRKSVCEFRDVYETVNLTRVRLLFGGSGRKRSDLGSELLQAGYEPALVHGHLYLWRRKDVERHFGAALNPADADAVSAKVSL